MNVIIDEVELYSHPEFQRTYIYSLIELLNSFGINSDKIKSINFIIATHSPFVVSDIPSDNILYLDAGKSKNLEGENGVKTFGANIYDLIRSSFFMDYPIGEIARKRIGRIFEVYHSKKNNFSEIKRNEEFYRYLTSIISDPYLSDISNVILNEMLDTGKSYKECLRSKRERLEKELQNMDNEIKRIDEEDRL